MMQAVILIGGRGERLRPFTENTRKAYLPLGKKRVIDHIIDRLPKDMNYSISENDSGAVAAVAEALTGDEPVLVICGDNYFTASLSDFVEQYHPKRILFGAYDIKDRELAKQYGVVELYPSGRLKNLEEKPQKPKSSLVSTGIYLFPPLSFDLVKRFADLNPITNIGTLLSALSLGWPVHGFILWGIWIDIGTHESYQRAQQLVK